MKIELTEENVLLSDKVECLCALYHAVKLLVLCTKVIE